MEPRELNEKLRREILSNLDGQAREKVTAEIDARERFALLIENRVEERCSCGLIMSRTSFLEHRKETKHEISPSKEKLETCSCGLVMSSLNMSEHQIETEHTSIPQTVQRERGPERPARTKPMGIKSPPDFSFDKYNSGLDP